MFPKVSVLLLPFPLCCDIKNLTELLFTAVIRLGMLDECIFYLKQSIALVSDPKFYKTKRISVRNKRVNHECKLKL